MSCIRKDSLPEIESLQRALCIVHKLGKLAHEQCPLLGSTARREGNPAWDIYMLAECVGIYLKEYCGHMGLEYESHLGKPSSIVGEEYLDKIWDGETNNWRKGGTK